ncbi:MAG: hypothetical protein HKN64_02735 [Woeseiaceae bacterium]|nr:hypothetical protein [Woeseiaceae bacterium]
MEHQNHKQSRKHAIALKADGNPEGKGLNGLLRDWRESRPRGVVAKPQPQLLAEFFTSMLVLTARFKYQPVVDTPNYLYWIDDQWMLSLVAPDEWSADRHASFAGTCVLQPDRTWTITPSDTLTERNAVSDAVSRFYSAFAEILDTERTLEDVLPFHVGNLPYYQRLNANALSRSIRGSVTLGEQASIPCRDWRLLLPRLDSLLLSHVA